MGASVGMANLTLRINSYFMKISVWPLAGVRRSLNKKIFLFYLVRRRLGPANTGELVGGTGSHLLFNERRTPEKHYRKKWFIWC